MWELSIHFNKQFQAIGPTVDLIQFSNASCFGNETKTKNKKQKKKEKEKQKTKTKTKTKTKQNKK